MNSKSFPQCQRYIFLKGIKCINKVAENENNNTDFKKENDLLEKCYRAISNINALYKSFRSIFQTKDTYKRTMREILRFSK